MAMRLILTIILSSLFLITSIQPLFSQEDPDEIAPPSPLENTLKKTLTDVEQENKRKEAEFIASLKRKLDLEVQRWVIEAKQKQETQLHKLIHNDWVKLDKFTTPVPYDYYIRDYDYPLVKADVLKADSLTLPYKAYIKLNEKLFIERYHSESISSIEPYLQTIITPITINLEYRDDKFVITNTEYGVIAIKNGWLRN